MNEKTRHARAMRFDQACLEANDETHTVLEWLFANQCAYEFWQAELVRLIDVPTPCDQCINPSEVRRSKAGFLLHHGFCKSYPAGGRTLPALAYGRFLRKVDWPRIADLFLNADATALAQD